MKRFITFAFSVLLCGVAWAGRTVYTNKIVNDPGLAYSKTIDTDISRLGIDTLSVQAVYSSASIPSVSWTDGGISSETLTVKSTSTLPGRFGTDTITVSNNALLARKAASVIINVASNTATALSGKSITINGAALSNPNDWTIMDVASNTAIQIKNAINTKLGDLTATTSGSSVTITVVQLGTGANAYTVVTSTPAALVASGSVFSGGQDAATFTFDGLIKTAGLDWTVADISSNTAINLVTAINADGAISPIVTASTTAATVVTLTCVTKGTACNSNTLAASTGLTAGGASFSGGQNPAYVVINGTTLTEGVDWTAVSTTSGSARAISDAIVANSTLNTVIASTWAAAVVYTTSTAVGVNAYSVYAWPPAAFAWKSTTTFIAGTASAYSLNGTQITATAHGLTLALPVLYSTSGFALSGLTNQTTYYAIPVDANTFGLSLTSTGAVAGSYITLASSSTAGPHTFTVAPLAITGTASFKWQSSNDGTNFFDLPNATSVTFGSPYTAATTIWDGTINFKWLRFNFTAPTTGAMNVVVTGQGKISTQ